MIMTKRAYLLGCFCLLAVFAFIEPPAFSQGGTGGTANKKAGFMRAVESARTAEKRQLAAPWVGVTTNGSPLKGLFSMKPTGVSTAPVRAGANAFISSLSADEKKQTLYAIDDPEWQKWGNWHFYWQQGVRLDKMTAKQRELALNVVLEGMSAAGYRKTRDIMRLNHTLAELTNNFDEYGEWLYYLTIMGEPSATEPWGWQFEGHHVIVNSFILGDQIVMTPVFMGSEPTVANSGKYQGASIMQQEQAVGAVLMDSLDAGQREKAIVAGKDGKPGLNNLGEAFNDDRVLDYSGIRASDLTALQQELLIDIVAEYVNTMKPGHAKVRLAEVRAHLDDTYFAWIGTTGPDGVYYYRVHSPVVLIEFDHQAPIALGAHSDPPSRRHVHSVIRTPNGNDYGKDLLRQHYARSHSAD